MPFPFCPPPLAATPPPPCSALRSQASCGERGLLGSLLATASGLSPLSVAAVRLLGGGALLIASQLAALMSLLEPLTATSSACCSSATASARRARQAWPCSASPSSSPRGRGPDAHSRSDAGERRGLARGRGLAFPRKRERPTRPVTWR